MGEQTNVEAKQVFNFTLIWKSKRTLTSTSFVVFPITIRYFKDFLFSRPKQKAEGRFLFWEVLRLAQ